MVRIVIVGLAMLATAGSAAAERWVVQRIGNWEVKAAKDPISDKEKVLAFVDANDPRGAYLRIACFDDLPSLAISFPDFKFRPKERVAVILRVDRNPPTKAEFGSIPDTGMAETGLTRTTYTALTQMSLAAVKLARETGDTRTATFPARKTKEAMVAMLKACPIETGGKSIPVQYDPSKPLFEPEKADTGTGKDTSEKVPSASSTAPAAQPLLESAPSQAQPAK